MIASPAAAHSDSVWAPGGPAARPKLAAFVAFAGPLDQLTRFARRSSPIR